MRKTYWLFLFITAIACGSMMILSTEKVSAQTPNMQSISFSPYLNSYLETPNLAGYAVDSLITNVHVDSNAKPSKQKLPTVTATPPGGTYNSAQTVTLTASVPSTIYYTTDGSTPTTSSLVYTSPILISTSTTLKFFAIDTSGITGKTVTDTYVINTAPSSPTGLAAIAGDSHISLSWNVPSSDGGSPITGYNIYRGATSGGEEATPIASVGSSITTYDNTELINGQQYFYKVTAVNSIGPSSASNEASATPVAAPTVPAAPTGLTPTAGDAQVSLAWTAASDGGAPISDYVVEFRTGANPFTTFADGVSTSTSAIVTGLTNAVSYDFRVSAVNSVGTSLPSTIASSTPFGTSTVPDAPTALTATAGDAHISLSWNASSSDGGSPITGYNIYRGTTSGGEIVIPISTVDSSITTYDDIGLTNGQQYFYKVSAINSIGSSSASNEASATPISGPTVPSAPTGLEANSISDSQINLSWVAPSNGGSAITGYEIERESPVGRGFSVLVTNIGNTTTYNDNGLNSNTQYNYQVSAINSVGKSSPSNQAAGTTQPSSLATLDKFGILEFHPTLTGGREWWNTWSNGIARTITAGKGDPYDPTGWFKVTGCCSGSTNPTVKIDGQGVANMSGGQPRMYIFDPNLIQKWHDVEITVYGMRVGEYTNPPDSAAGINIAGRSNHQNESTSVCGVNTYYSRMLYSGYGNFAKELNHPDDSKVPSTKNQLDWSQYNGTTMPKNVWIGHKMILRNIDNGTHVRLEMWRDLTDGLNGGNWQLMINYTDTGNWYDSITTGCPTTDLNHIITEPEFSTFIRNTGVSSVLYKNWSIREISPLQ